MKENAILKINQIGKVSSIFTTIAKILTGIGFVLCLITAIAFAAIPEDFLTMKISGDAVIDMNLGAIGKAFDASDVEEFEQESDALGNGISFYINSTNYTVKAKAATEDSLQLEAVSEDTTMNLHNLVWVMLMGTLSLGMTMVTLFFIGALCKAFRNCTSPFEENVTKKMQNLAISLVPWAFLTSITDALAQSYFTGKFQFAMGIDLNMVLIILLIFVLAYIFKYGAVLQTESDETL